MGSINIDQSRINRTGTHILRGLYYLHIQKPIPTEADLRVGSMIGLHSEHPDMQTNRENIQHVSRAARR